MSNLERMSFTVPLIPPSVNHYKTRFRNGRTVVSQEALAFKAELALAAKHQYVVGKEFSVDMLIVLGKGEKGDVDNFPKLVLDGLAACGFARGRRSTPMRKSLYKTLRNGRMRQCEISVRFVSATAEICWYSIRRTGKSCTERDFGRR